MPEIYVGEPTPNTPKQLQSAHKQPMHLCCSVVHEIMIHETVHRRARVNKTTSLLYLIRFICIRCVISVPSFVKRLACWLLCPSTTYFGTKQHPKIPTVDGSRRESVQISGNLLSEASSITVKCKQNCCKCDKKNVISVHSQTWVRRIVLGLLSWSGRMRGQR